MFVGGANQRRDYHIQEGEEVIVVAVIFIVSVAVVVFDVVGADVSIFVLGGAV